MTAVFIMLLLLSLGYFVSTFTLTEKKISSSQAASVQAYYLAESGVNEAIWKLKNDAAWKSNFESSDSWSTTTVRTSALYPNASYVITVTNSSKANAAIVVTGKINLGLASSQRVIKTNIYKALGESAIGHNGEYADGNIDMSGTNLSVLNGGIFSNNNIIVNYWSHISATGDVKAVGNINVNNQSSISASSTQSSNLHPPAPDPIAMPAVSFDNAGDASSYKARASHIYTAKQFSDLLYANRNKTLTLNGITYVTGDVTIEYYNDIVINGCLVADGNITVGENTLSCIFGGRSNVTINNPGDGSPSGLFSKGRIDFELCMENFSGQAVVYANDKINVLALPNQIAITGALISRKLTLTSLWQGFTITYDPDIVNPSIGNPTYSPVITVDHWEEEY